VFDGFKTAADVKAASETTKAAGENFRFVSSGVRFRLRSAFVDLLRAQELIRVTKEIAKLRRDNLVLISLRYQSGLEHKGALLTAEANLEEAKFETAQAIRNRIVGQRQLTKEMGRETFVPVTVKGELDAGGAAQKKPDFEAIVKDNPSLQKLLAQENAAAFGVSAAKRNFFPTLTAQAGAGRTGAHWPPGDDGDRWNMGLGLSLPIFEGGLRMAQVAQAQAALNQARAEERSTRDGVIVALEQAWASWQDALETIDVQKKFLAASEERARIAEAQYAIGLISYDNWTIIEDDLVRAKKALLDAQANALLAEAAWVQAKGETLEHEE
jgi:outer membrane protein TolC